MKELAQEEKTQKQNEIRLLEEEIMIQLLPKIKMTLEILSWSLEPEQEEMKQLFS